MRSRRLRSLDGAFLYRCNFALQYNPRYPVFKGNLGKMRFGLGVFVGLALLAAPPGTVRAHPLLDQGIASYEEADFTAALEAFDAASRDAWPQPESPW
jgi:hypothetical protein